MTLTWYFTVGVPGSPTMDRATAPSEGEPNVDTERDMTIEADEDHIVRGLD